ncbi:uncharacterized protein LOC128260644 [Drosophila gunungcola]|uniref:Uncharacterized protein n=1 Tax=Drosophila gunungcola TaxID=103775 RepID=A0A9Q0BK63_9MUSC|nr:uncharacterized protein LOC128260644 [Drosophila gunungcola]KAI8035507.1 hypothetical protein M5D96_011730 [Drosophila gunungcola]
MAVGYKFSMEDFPVPDDFTTAIYYVVAFLSVWCVILYVTRSLKSIFWPMMIVISGLFVYRVLRTFDPMDFLDMFVKALELTYDLCFELYQRFVGSCPSDE